MILIAKPTAPTCRVGQVDALLLEAGQWCIEVSTEPWSSSFDYSPKYMIQRILHECSCIIEFIKRVGGKQ